MVNIVMWENDEQIHWSVFWDCKNLNLIYRLTQKLLSF
jgi:hypothetical protein